MSLVKLLMGVPRLPQTIVLPDEVGTPFQGGYYSGVIVGGDQKYALIVAPKATGDASKRLKTAQSATANTASTWDGAANTAAMIAEGGDLHPAAQFCRDLNINGYTDWVLPAKDQLELLYRVFKPNTTANNTSSGANPSSDPAGANYTSGSPTQTSVAAFQAGGSEAFVADYYWASTQYASNSSYECIQTFNSGFQNNTLKTNTYRVRAVRMIPI